MKTAVAVSLLLALLVSPVLAQAAKAPEEEEIPRLPEVSVTETRNPVEVESLTGRTAIRDLEESRDRGAWTIEEAINDIPAVDIEGTARYGQEVKIQMRGVTSGFSTQRVLLLLDGRPLTQEYTGNVDVAQFPLASFERVEVAQGPASAVYGSNAIGGVVNFLPRRGGEVPVTEIYFEGGSFSTYTGGFAHGSKIGPVDLFFNIDSTSTNGYLSNSAGDPMDWHRTAGFVNLGYSTEKADIRAYFYGLEGGGTDESFERTIDRWSADLAFTYDVSPEHDAVLRVRAWVNDHEQELEWFFGATTDYDLLTTGLNVTQTWAVTPAHLLTGGGESYRQEAKVDEPQGNVDETSTIWSLFLQDEWSVTDTVRLVGGLRYDKVTDIDGEFSWRFGANWRISDEVTLRGSAGKAFRTPPISDRYLPTTQYFGMTFEGNPLLEPETLRNAEIGADWYFAPGFSAGATVFASEADGFIDFIMDPDGVFRPGNITSVEFRGVGATFVGDLGSGFGCDASYAYTDAIYKDFEGREDVEGNRIDGNVLHFGTLTFNWRHEDGHGARISGLFSGDRVTDPENSDAGTLSTWVVVNLQAHYEVAEFAVLTLSVMNLLDEEYATRPEYPQPGRGAFLGVRVSF